MKIMHIVYGVTLVSYSILVGSFHIYGVKVPRELLT